MHISFVASDDKKIIRVYCDDEGADVLIELLQITKRNKDHTHIYSGTRGAMQFELSPRSPYTEEAALEVIINFVDSD